MNEDFLKDFEEEVATHFNNGSIRGPIHLYSNNEKSLINIFQHIRDQDWVFCSWRSHYQCLLKGVDREELMASILDGKSISLNFPKHKVYSSAIVGGSSPWAVGVAISIKERGVDQHVFCFIGDMTSETGILQTCIAYSSTHDLPITFVIEDNNSSVMTNTRKVWNSDNLRYQQIPNKNVISYNYQSKWPHAGAGKRVQF